MVRYITNNFLIGWDIVNRILDFGYAFISDILILKKDFGMIIYLMTLCPEDCGQN